MISLVFLLLLCIGSGVEARLLSLDTDITSEKGSSSLTIHRKQTPNGVGLEVELLTVGSEASPHVLVSAVSGCAVTVRQFSRGSKVATVIDMLAPLGSRVSHAARISARGHLLKDIRVGKTLVRVSHAEDGGVVVSIWPDSGKTRWRASVSAKLGEQHVHMHNTAELDRRTGKLRAGFEVELPLPGVRGTRARRTRARRSRRSRARRTRHTTETESSTDLPLSLEEPVPKTRAPRTSHGVLLSDSEARDMDLLSDDGDGASERTEHGKKKRRRKRSAKKTTESTTATTLAPTSTRSSATTTTTTTTTTASTTTTSSTPAPTPKPTEEPDEEDDVMGLARTKATVDMIKSVSPRKTPCVM